MITLMDADIVALQKWWMNELQALTKKVMDQEARRQAKAVEKADRLMGEYKTFADIQDAYGCGVISSRKRDRLYDLLEQRNVEPDRLYGFKLDLLSELYQTAKQTMEAHNNE